LKGERVFGQIGALAALNAEAGEAKHVEDPFLPVSLPFYRKTGDFARGRNIFVDLNKKTDEMGRIRYNSVGVTAGLPW
jgi:hypothetical protein